MGSAVDEFGRTNAADSRREVEARPHSMAHRPRRLPRTRLKMKIARATMTKMMRMVHNMSRLRPVDGWWQCQVGAADQRTRDHHLGPPRTPSRSGARPNVDDSMRIVLADMCVSRKGHVSAL